MESNKGRKRGGALGERKKVKTEGTKYKGVAWHVNYNRYRARIKINGTTTHLGYFDTADQAAVAYDRAAYELRGSKAQTNFPIENYIDHGLNPVVPMSPKTKCIAAAKTALDFSNPSQFSLAAPSLYSAVETV